MDLSKQISQIKTEVKHVEVLEPISRHLPMTEVQAKIEKACFPGMHYPNVFSTVGKLVSRGVANHDTILENKHIIDKYISPNSGEKDSTRAILDHKKGYPNQFGSRACSASPADCFGQEVYENLPLKLRPILNLIDDWRKRDTALQGIITALSAAFSRWRFFHGTDTDVKEFSPHILSLAIGAAGSGKGLTRYGYLLVKEIENKAIEMGKSALANYKNSKADYDYQKHASYKKGKTKFDLLEPEKPPKYRFHMSASDTTQAALVEILHQNPIGGFAYDSEVDTLVQSNARKDFGGFSDVIRKVFQHEPLTRQRKGDAESYTVQQPRLAIMLSGTHDQLRKLIPSEKNGLFSRIWYYVIPPSFQEYKIATNQKDVVGQACIDLQHEIMETANLWSDELYTLSFSESQEQDLWNSMQDKKSIEERYGGDIGASWLRMALITKRIAVTLAAFEGCKEGKVPDNCWIVAMGILKVMKGHCIQALNIIRKNNGKIELSEEKYSKLKGSGMTDNEIATHLGINRKTISRKKAEWKRGTLAGVPEQT